MVALFALAVLALLTTRALENQQTSERRAREEELMFVGQAYLAAIAQYYEQSPGTEKHFPAALQDLLLDTRAVRLRRPLRRLYPDPVGGGAGWGMVEAPDGGIMGVYSLSTREPVKVHGFPEKFAAFSQAKSYRDWVFSYAPPSGAQP